MLISLEMNPQHIVKRSQEFRPTPQTEVMDGDWDSWSNTFEDSVDFFSSFKQLLETRDIDDESTDSLPAWRETSYYNRVAKLIDDGQRSWGCNTRDQLDERCLGLEKLYRDMRDNGWVDGEELDRVGINISRDGEVLFNNGRHRLVMAKLLGLEKIRVNINVIHAEWQKFIDDEVVAYGTPYAPLHHPTLQHVPSHHGRDRLDRILANVSPELWSREPRPSLLDIGSHWGFMGIPFAQQGWDVLSVESSAKHSRIQSKLTGMYPTFTVESADIFSLEAERIQTSVVFALNIYHHFIKTEALHTSLIRLLGDLRCQEMFFESHRVTEGQMEGAFRNYEPEEFCQFLIEHSVLENFEFLGHSARDNRQMFKLTTG